MKLARHIITHPLTVLIKRCFDDGIFPTAFKTSLITPVHKSGDRDTVTNYRPISVLTTLSKIFEKVLNNRLTKYLEQNKILSDKQYGFRSGKSTEDAVCKLTNHVAVNLDSKQKTLAVFLDLAKAFDSVSIPRLISKLEHGGIRGNALNIY